MSRRTRVRFDDDNVEARFASKAKMLVDLIAPQDFYSVLGRGSAKTSDIVAERSMNIIHDMPRSYQMFLSDTYANALSNVLPALIEGWQRNPRYNFIDFVEMFVTIWDESPRERQITIIEVPQKFTREQRIMLNQIKEQAKDVEFEEIQG